MGKFSTTISSSFLLKFLVFLPSFFFSLIKILSSMFLVVLYLSYAKNVPSFFDPIKFVWFVFPAEKPCVYYWLTLDIREQWNVKLSEQLSKRIFKKRIPMLSYYIAFNSKKNFTNIPQNILNNRRSKKGLVLPWTEDPSMRVIRILLLLYTALIIAAR